MKGFFSVCLMVLVVAVLFTGSASGAIMVSNHQHSAGDKFYVFDVEWGKDPSPPMVFGGQNFGSDHIGQLGLTYATFGTDNSLPPENFILVEMYYLYPLVISGVSPQIFEYYDLVAIIFESPENQRFTDATILDFGPDSYMLDSINPSGSGYGARFTYYIDKPRGPESVPEPSTLGIFLAGFALLSGARGLRKK